MIGEDAPEARIFEAGSPLVGRRRRRVPDNRKASRAEEVASGCGSVKHVDHQRDFVRKA